MALPLGRGRSCLRKQIWGLAKGQQIVICYYSQSEWEGIVGFSCLRCQNNLADLGTTHLCLYFFEGGAICCSASGTKCELEGRMLKTTLFKDIEIPGTEGVGAADRIYRLQPPKIVSNWVRTPKFIGELPVDPSNREQQLTDICHSCIIKEHRCHRYKCWNKGT